MGTTTHPNSAWCLQPAWASTACPALHTCLGAGRGSLQVLKSPSTHPFQPAHATSLSREHSTAAPGERPMSLGPTHLLQRPCPPRLARCLLCTSWHSELTLGTALQVSDGELKDTHNGTREQEPGKMEQQLGASSALSLFLTGTVATITMTNTDSGTQVRAMGFGPPFHSLEPSELFIHR